MSKRFFNLASKSSCKLLRLSSAITLVAIIGLTNVVLAQTDGKADAQTDVQADAETDPPTAYWPEGVEWDDTITTPREFFGFEIGQRHLTHQQIVDYIRQVALESDRVEAVPYGRTHGGRPLMLVTVTSPDNHRRLDQIRRDHRALTRAATPTEQASAEIPAVINMGYSVHGDEPSAANCAPLVLHYLAAAKGAQIDSILRNCVILLDPCLNPDGFDRFAAWANALRGRVPNPDAQHAEHNQNWPPGRVNYYWFDLNRDWLPLEHPESRSRMRWYHQWKPDVVLDFHEMGTGSTFFFQPGIPERTNPRTPARNMELTAKIGQYHARALDRRGSLYFTEEQFDDFYMGKGSTYPDLHGAIGILFEQASSRGQLQRNDNGLLRFRDTIANQFTVSLSSMRATTELRQELLDFKHDFYAQARDRAARHPGHAYLFHIPDNRSRLEDFADVLTRHDIRCYWPTQDIKVKGTTYPAAQTLLVPIRQPEFEFLQSLLMRRKVFKENIFYDVSTWTLPLAYGLAQVRVDQPLQWKDMQPARAAQSEAEPFEADPSAIAYLIDWADDEAAWLLGRLLKKNVNVKVARKEFSIQSESGPRNMAVGTLMIPLGIQPNKRATIEELLVEGAARGASIIPVDTGLTPTGIDFGSGNFRTIPKPSVAMPIGSDVSAYGAGEVWHQMDLRMGLPLTLLKSDRFGRYDLDEYNVLVLPSGGYSGLGSADWDRIREWVQGGGTVIAIGASCQRVYDRIQGQAGGMLGDTDDQESIDRNPEESVQQPFDSAARKRALQLISGAIFNAKCDLTHPLFYGQRSSRLAVFRNHTTFVAPSDNPFCNPAIYDSQRPHLAGYCSEENLEKLKPSAAVVVRPIGRGRVIQIVEDPLFRAFWHGPERIFVNAIYFGQLTNP